MWPAVQPISRVALVLSPAIGDSLLMMTVARNLRHHGIEVTVFGRQIRFLRDWFPGVDAREDLAAGDPGAGHLAAGDPAADYPASNHLATGLLAAGLPAASHPAANFTTTGVPAPADLASRLSGFDYVLQMHRNKPFIGLEHCHPRVIFLDHLCRARSPESMADRLARFCRNDLGLASAHKSNGMTAPAGLQHRKYPLRVAIHPTASTADKCWLASRFIRLAFKLRELGFSPEFVVAPQERADWLHIERLGLALPDLGSLDSVASWIFESGWFIGNDSGIGHLASSLHIPTLSLFMRRGLAHTWRPDWGAGQVLIGSTYLPTGFLKERYWKYMLSVRQVSRAFEQLRTNFHFA